METHPSDKELMAQGVGQVIGELLGAFVGVINALRKQSGFDDGAFREEIQTLLRHSQATPLQQHAFKMLLQDEGAPASPQAEAASP